MRYCIERESLLAAMRATSGLAPILMITAVMSIYIGWLSPTESSSVYAGIWALLLGTVLGFIIWLGVILIARHFVTIDRANSAVYSELRSRFSIARQLGKLANEALEKKRAQAHSEHGPSKDTTKDTATNEGLVYTRTEAIACIERLEYVLGDE